MVTSNVTFAIMAKDLLHLNVLFVFFLFPHVQFEQAKFLKVSLKLPTVHWHFNLFFIMRVKVILSKLRFSKISYQMWHYISVLRTRGHIGKTLYKKKNISLYLMGIHKDVYGWKLCIIKAFQVEMVASKGVPSLVSCRLLIVVHYKILIYFRF